MSETCHVLSIRIKSSTQFSNFWPPCPQPLSISIEYMNHHLTKGSFVRSIGFHFYRNWSNLPWHKNLTNKLSFSSAIKCRQSSELHLAPRDASVEVWRPFWGANRLGTSRDFMDFFYPLILRILGFWTAPHLGRKIHHPGSPISQFIVLILAFISNFCWEGL